MIDQEQNNEPKRNVGISGVNMDGSSISNTIITATNSQSGNVGIHNLDMKNSHISGVTITDEEITSELTSYGLIESEISEIKEIIQSSKEDKPSFSGKVLKWLGSVTAAVAGRGLYDSLPMIGDFAQKIIAQFGG